MMNILQTLKISLNDAMKVQGDLIDFRVFQGTMFIHLVASAYQFKRMAYGIDTFTGLTTPTELDMQENFTYSHTKNMYSTSPAVIQESLKRFVKSDANHRVIKGEQDEALKEIPNHTQFSFALIDLFQYQTTADALKYLWEKMSFGGTIFITNYAKNSKHSANLAITEFLEKHDDEIMYNEQLVYNGILEDHLIIKCFNPSKRPRNWKEFLPKVRPLSVAMVLRTGGEVYDYKYVNALANALRKNSTIDYEIVCLTNNPTGFNSKIDRIVPFKHQFPKWWGKIELFRDDIFGDNRVIYLDLDTVIVKNIDDILSFEVEFSGLRDFYHLHSLGSGMMAWLPEKMRHVYEGFIKNPTNVIHSYTQGDQRWIDEHKPSIVFLQDTFPNQIVSYKKNCAKGKDIIIPNKAEIICFHGNPRPHSITDPIIQKLWVP